MKIPNDRVMCEKKNYTFRRGLLIHGQSLVGSLTASVFVLTTQRSRSWSMDQREQRVPSRRRATAICGSLQVVYSSGLPRDLCDLCT